VLEFSSFFSRAPELFSDGCFGLGDTAYTNYIWLMTKFKGYSLSRTRLRFNSAHGRMRSVIERAFGKLKGRWRRLTRLDFAFKKGPPAIIACCYLHNFLENANEQFLDDWFLEEEEMPDPEDSFEEDPINRADMEVRNTQKLMEVLSRFEA